MRIVKMILKTLVYLWAAFWAAFCTYITIGVLRGKLDVKHCECGGTRCTSKGKLYGWMFR